VKPRIKKYRNNPRYIIKEKVVENPKMPMTESLTRGTFVGFFGHFDLCTICWPVAKLFARGSERVKFLLSLHLCRRFQKHAHFYSLFSSSFSRFFISLHLCSRFQKRWWIFLCVFDMFLKVNLGLFLKIYGFFCCYWNIFNFCVVGLFSFSFFFASYFVPYFLFSVIFVLDALFFFASFLCALFFVLCYFFPGCANISFACVDFFVFFFCGFEYFQKVMANRVGGTCFSRNLVMGMRFLGPACSYIVGEIGCNLCVCWNA